MRIRIQVIRPRNAWIVEMRREGRVKSTSHWRSVNTIGFRYRVITKWHHAISAVYTLRRGSRNDRSNGRERRVGRMSIGIRNHRLNMQLRCRLKGVVWPTDPIEGRKRRLGRNRLGIGVWRRFNECEGWDCLQLDHKGLKNYHSFGTLGSGFAFPVSLSWIRITCDTSSFDKVCRGNTLLKAIAIDRDDGIREEVTLVSRTSIFPSLTFIASLPYHLEQSMGEVKRGAGNVQWGNLETYH